ncbi:MAG: hypothetical protein ACRDSH_23310 [Pseudonocardiaceae bacterium]
MSGNLATHRSVPSRTVQRMDTQGMHRIAIIGCGGSGKTTLGRRHAAAIGAPITHLDAVYYDDEWNTLPPEKFAAVQQDLVAADT